MELEGCEGGEFGGAEWPDVENDGARDETVDDRDRHSTLRKNGRSNPAVGHVGGLRRRKKSVALIGSRNR